MFWGSLLLRAGDVERNPGPGPSKTDGLRQTRLTSAARRTSTGGPSDSGQTTSPSSESSPPTLTDIMAMLHSMNTNMDSKFNDVEKSVKELTGQCASLQSVVRDLREEVGALMKDNQELLKANSELVDKVAQLEKKTDDLEGRSKRNNLIFYGIPRDRNETNETCEDKVQDLITDKLEIARDVQFDRVHRLSPKPDSPIIACCCSYKDKVNILKVKRKLQGTHVFVGEDFSTRVREIRRKLSLHLKSARVSGKRATMVFDHLIIDGKKFFLDGSDRLKESR
jgi:regulator of replication initiation timing